SQSGAVEVTYGAMDPAAAFGVTGIAQGNGQGPLNLVNLSASPPQTLDAGAILEAFAHFNEVSDQQVAREFYKTHPDKFDYLSIQTDFTTDGLFHSVLVSNQTHGIGSRLDPSSGQPFFPTTVDFSSAYGSAGELETIVFMNNVDIFPSSMDAAVNPAISPY